MALVADGEVKDAGGAILGGDVEFLGGDSSRSSWRFSLGGGAAERVDAGHEGEFADGDAVDEVFATAVNGVFDFDGVVAVGGEFCKEDGVGVEAEVVVVGDLLALGVVEREGGLKPARHGVGEIGNEGAGAGGEHRELLTLARGETIAVDLTGENLAVDGVRQGDRGIGLFDDRGAGTGGGAGGAVGGEVAGGDDRSDVFAELADDEGDRVLGERPLAVRRRLALSGWRVGANGEFEGGGWRWRDWLGGRGGWRVSRGLRR